MIAISGHQAKLWLWWESSSTDSSCTSYTPTTITVPTFTFEVMHLSRSEAEAIDLAEELLQEKPDPAEPADVRDSNRAGWYRQRGRKPARCTRRERRAAQQNGR